jgi:VWD domain-containing protein
MVRKVAAFLFMFAAVFFVGSPAHAAEAGDPTPGGGLHLSVSAGPAGGSPTGAVVLTATVTNGSGTACDVVDVPDGGLFVTSARRDGVGFTPQIGRARLVNGAGGEISAHIRTLAPGRSVGFAVDSVNGVTVLAPLRDGTALATSYPVNSVGRYEFRFFYRTPPMAGTKGCAESSNEASVAFTVGHPRSGVPVYLLIVGAAAVVVLAVLVMWLVRRSRRGKAVGVAAVLTLAAALLVTLDARPAQAKVDASLLPPDVLNTYSGCVPLIAGFDPGLFQRLNAGPPPSVFITEEKGGDSRSDSFGSTTIIHWNAKQSGSFFGDYGGATIDPCAELYHELVHADDALFPPDDRYCDKTGIPYDEVKATILENAFRVTRGLLPRTTYLVNNVPLPLPDLGLYQQLGFIHGAGLIDLLDDYCFHLFPPPKNRPTQIPNTGPKSHHCGAVSCGTSNGDPHLFTFDQGYYDFQTVGEFVATQASTSDLVVQVRQAPYAGSRLVAVNVAVAVRIGATKFGFYFEGGALTVHQDGRPASVPIGQTTLSGGSIERRQDPLTGDGYVLHWPDGSQVAVVAANAWGVTLSVALAAGRKKAVTGLLGDDDGSPANDVPSTADRYRSFAERWRVSDATSLFDYGPGQSTATFTDRTFPDRPTTTADLSGPARDLAQAACAPLNLEDPVLLDACLLDVAVTGQTGFATAAQDIDDGMLTDPAEPVPTQGPTTTTKIGSAPTLISVSYPGEVSRLEFPGHKSQRITVEISSATLPETCRPFALLAPNSTEIGSSCVINGAGLINEITLPADGTYALVLDPAGRDLGSALIRIDADQDQTGTIQIDGPPVTLTIGTPGSAARVTFTATAGQKVFVDVVSATLADSCFPLSVRRPGDDAQIGIGCIIHQSGFVDGTVLPVSGRYSIYLNPPDLQTGTATIRLISVADQNGVIVLNGPLVTATIAGPGAVARFTFHGTAGQAVSVDATGGTLPDECNLGLFDGGTQFGFACIVNGVGTMKPTVLPHTGEYTIVINPGERGTGHVQLRLHT